MKIRSALALVAALVVTGALTSPAHAANEVRVSMVGGVLYDTCGDYGFSYAASLPAGYGPYWNMDLELIGPDGNIAASTYLYGEAASGVDTMQICNSPNLPGTYTIRGTGETRNSSSDYIPISVLSSSVTFRLPMTRTSIKATPKKPEKGQVVRFAITSTDERPNGYFGTAYADVRLQVRRGGSWKTLTKTSTNDSGRVVAKARHSGKKVRVRALTDGSSSHTGSTSRIIKVG
ncbi:hypothetical protein [Nocardioides sp.]|uniref:hypothetical protein n=1 Tax=Nocardioides sp. TaxID=35761 RepID=UPI0035B1C21B